MQNPQFCLIRRLPRRRFARLLVLLPRRLLALGGAEVAGFAPCASFRCGGLTDVALVGRLLQHVLHLNQLSLVVLHVLDERASVVIDAEDLLVDKLFGEVLSEEAEKASLATDPLVLPPPSLHSPPLSMTDNNLRILLSSDNHLGYNDKDPIRARLLCSL